MNNTQTPNEDNDDLLPEYNFEYKKARPNHFVTYKPCEYRVYKSKLKFLTLIDNLSVQIIF
ncbi:hypothetical protein CAL7716_092330 [Calothrix sp. PCC 7716]|nr:hypothetical protein CAL7716_092330 [Calothrix sp. PCC 7716]